MILRIEATAGQIRARLPASIATVQEFSDDEEKERWRRVELRVQELDWLPPLLAALDRPFVIEQPEALRGLVRALADRLSGSAERG